MLRSLVGSEMCIRDSINAEYGEPCACSNGVNRPMPASSDAHDKTPLWRDVLSTATASNSSLDSKTLIVLGDPNVGKHTLINSLRGQGDDVARSEGEMALQYTYMSFKLDEEDEGDQSARLNVWKLADPDHASLLKFALKPQDLAGTMVLIMVDFSRPWSMHSSVQTWLQIIQQALLAAFDECPDTSVVQDLETNLVKFMQSYSEPAEDGSGSPKSSKIMTADDDEVLLPLGEDVLSTNLGVPIVLVCNKADAINKFESECEYQDSDFDFIQSALRQVALKYGAALLYTAPRGEEPHSGTTIPVSYTHLTLPTKRIV
eukprot:TRINITY_DN1056_c0_g1_i2.p1 TRINITY_DN1056_c0_g1~~TRINITY_DN1056_c0_g1_i2.p1  ORF type:complete len:344 (-),score=103.12 TRINITY_DN1056_c0_g1_i2:98-1048(-)